MSTNSLEEFAAAKIQTSVFFFLWRVIVYLFFFCFFFRQMWSYEISGLITPEMGLFEEIASSSAHFRSQKWSSGNLLPLEQLFYPKLSASKHGDIPKFLFGYLNHKVWNKTKCIFRGIVTFVSPLSLCRGSKFDEWFISYRRIH